MPHRKKSHTPQPIVRPRPEHCISRRDICPDALKVLYRLLRRGHTAYLVGGGVRDLLLKRKPKDFDVGTSAHPGQIKKMFRNCFLIGRRFRLAHIKYGDNIIETSTFRRPPEEPDEGESLLQTEDNTFGTPEEDARRRDFTINGLFYDIETFGVIDYVGGLDDLEHKLIRCVGDPGVRFREDPVRMIRAVRFASRLGFTIEPNTDRALREHCQEIEKASAPRMLEEIYRLFGFGSGEPAFRLLYDTGMLRATLPYLADSLDKDPDGSPMWRYLAALDDVARNGGPETEALRMCALHAHLAFDHAGPNATLGDFAHSAKIVLEPFYEHFPLPRRVRDRYNRIVTALRRFSPDSKRRFSKERLMEQPYFEEALAFYGILTQVMDYPTDSLQTWRDRYAYFLEHRPAPTVDPNSNATRSSRRSRSRRRRGSRGGRKKNNTSPAAPNAENSDQSASSDDGTTKKKRRPRRSRRKKKPSSE